MVPFRRNIAASYVAQIYSTLIGIVLLPLYLKFMGTEAYGLVGFYAVLQGWFMLLDMGFTPTMAREAARFRGNAINGCELRVLLRALEGIFVGTASLGAFLIACSSTFIANRWLNVQHLPIGEVEGSLKLVGAIIALRWISDLYRGVITGLEKLVWLNAFNMVIATLRFVLVIPFFIYVGTSPTQFFGYQLAVAFIEVAVLNRETYQRLPRADEPQKVASMLRRVRGVFHFSFSVAFTGVAWVVATQTDKLILSKLLPLSEYAYFTLVVLVASGVMVLSVPISGPLIPRMVALNAEGKEEDLIRIYRNATQLVAVVAVPTAAVLAMFSRQVLWAWTGDKHIAQRAAEVLTLYAIGNGILALSAFPYYLQFAKGDLRLHLIGSGLFIVVLVPSLVWATSRYGVVGAGYAWCGANAAYFALWIPVVHRRFARGLQTLWLTRDVAGIVLATGLCGAAARSWVRWPVNRGPAAMLIVLFGMGLLLVAGAASPWMRATILSNWRARGL
jgi:O-antigen/teichoic acid export membrane protein